MSTQIPTGTTAHDILAGVKSRKFTKKAAIAFLQARVEGAIAKGRIPRKASVDALETLGHPVAYERDTLRTRKQIAKGTATLRERRATAAAKPKASKKPAIKRASKKPNKADVEAKVAELLAEFGEDEVLVAYTKHIAK